MKVPLKIYFVDQIRVISSKNVIHEKKNFFRNKHDHSSVNVLPPFLKKKKCQGFFKKREKPTIVKSNTP